MKTKKSLLMLSVFYLLLNSCSTKDHAILNENKLNLLKKNIIEKGDRNSYVKLGEYYCGEKDDCSTMLPYSIVMSFRYNDKEMNNNIFLDLISVFTGKKIVSIQDFNSLTEDQKKIVLFFIKNGAENNDLGCINTLNKLNKLNKASQNEQSITIDK